MRIRNRNHLQEEEEEDLSYISIYLLMRKHVSCQLKICSEQHHNLAAYQQENNKFSYFHESTIVYAKLPLSISNGSINFRITINQLNST